MTNTQSTYPILLIDTEQNICKLVYKSLVRNKIPKTPNRAMTNGSRYLHVHRHSQLTQSFVLFNTNTY